MRKTYAAIEERGLPLAFHGGFMWGGDRTMELCNRFIAVHALGFTFYNIVHLTNWLVNGMPERFPKLKIDLDRERARLAPVPDAAARQRIHDALVRGAALEAQAVATTCARCISRRSRWRWWTTARRSS